MGPMPDDPNPVKPPLSFQTLADLLAELAKEDRAHIRLVKVEDQGLVEPVRQGKALVMQPRIRVVATAFDYKTNEILRWERKWDVGVGRGTSDPASGSAGHGPPHDPTGTRTRDEVIAAFESRGYQVSRGEWTPRAVLAALAGLRAS